MRSGLIASLFAVCMLCSSLAGAATPTVHIAIDAHRFKPTPVHVPVGQRVRLRVTNTRTLPSEFESFDLNREEVVPPHMTVTVWIGPLSPGKYKIFDDFNRSTKGVIVAAKGVKP